MVPLGAAAGAGGGALAPPHPLVCRTPRGEHFIEVAEVGNNLVKVLPEPDLDPSSDEHSFTCLHNVCIRELVVVPVFSSIS